ncbi:ATP-dependent rRNA helicase spb4 [Lecanora helva]
MAITETSRSNHRAWENLKPSLSEWVLEAMKSSYQQMTQVQAATIPLFSGNKDVVVEAVTGSGKTLAYVLPTVSKILRLEERTKKHHVASIIVSPTRELASQICRVVENLLEFHAPSTAARRQLQHDSSEDDTDEEQSQEVYPPSTPVVVPQLLVGGETSVGQDLSAFLKNSPNLLIATPGRLLELLNSPHVQCPQSSFEVLVLDEADRLLDLGFKDDLQKILGRLPKQRRTGLFSASVSEAMDSIVRVGLRNPVKVQVKVRGASGEVDRRTPSRHVTSGPNNLMLMVLSLQMTYLITPASHKLPAVSKILSTLQPIPNKTIIYLSTCSAVDYLSQILPSILPSRDAQSFKLLALHGKQLPKVRQKTFTAFANATSPSILLTTDVAARGLDVPLVDLVLQLDPPSDSKVFLHRCGRTGRAGRKGLSIVFLRPGHEEDYIHFLDRRKTPVNPLKAPEVSITEEAAHHITEQIRYLVLSDRALHDTAQKAFVSAIKAYSKHEASSIFRLSSINWSDLGNAWGLLKLPKMPELKSWQGDRSLGVDLDWDTYAYKDKKREEMRRQALAERKNEQSQPSSQTTTTRDKRAWSDKLDAREERERRREKKRHKREHERWEKMTPAQREEQRELERMIEEVRAQGLGKEDAGSFEGFGD